MSDKFTATDCHDWLCPDLTAYWLLGQGHSTDEVILIAKDSSIRYHFNAVEGYALRYFTGRFTVEEIGEKCRAFYGNEVSPDFVIQLLEKLIELGILEDTRLVENSTSNPLQKELNGISLKPCVQWIARGSSYWILRNPEDVTFLQVSARDKAIIQQLEQLSPAAIIQEFSITPEHLQYLLQLLAATAMLKGSKPIKPRRGKFNPMQLLFFKISLFNPDDWLTRNINKLRWLFSWTWSLLLCLFLTFSTVIGINQQAEILFKGKHLIAAYGADMLLPFVLLSLLVVTLHELGHAFTLKHYGGIVPDVGLLFMCLMPAAYTNTTDSYCLSRFKRVLVVAAGIIVQLQLAAIGLWLWNFSQQGSWLNTSSYLLMAAALFTVILNLNPLAKFDGYYLAVAITGINNLRSRGFGFYGNLLTGKPIKDTFSVRLILAIYAPFSLAYIWFVFGFLIWRIIDWVVINIPATALILLAFWLIYFYLPRNK
jgi:putative peptide zinc metalloprotease protein